MALILPFPMINCLAKRMTLVLALAFAGCVGTDKTTFLNYGIPASSTQPSREEMMEAPRVSDGLAVNYANSIQVIMRCNSTRSRIVREVSATAQVGLAAFSGIGAAFSYGTTTLTALGLGSASIPELQKIFNAKGRAEIYNQAADMIRDGLLDYYSHDTNPSSTELTPNGLTLVKKVASAISLVDTTLVGQLPSQKQMLQAVEEMSPSGTKVQNPKAPPVNAVHKLTPVVIEKTVIHSVGLQSEQVRAITVAAGTLLKNPNLTSEQAQAVADHLKIVVGNGQEPKEALSEALSESDISPGKAADILKELQKQVPQ